MRRSPMQLALKYLFYPMIASNFELTVTVQSMEYNLLSGLVVLALVYFFLLLDPII
jgi:hypothetical protein